jgi:hypothetical protein
MPLITLEDLGKAVRQTLTEGTTIGDFAQSVIDRVSSAVTSEIAFLFEVTGVEERSQADYTGVITLAKRPVSAITSVSTIDGLARTGWSWDGLDEIDCLEAHEVVDIAYTAGFASAPEDLELLALGVAVRLFSNPTGVRQQTVGAISETTAAGAGEPGTVYFTPYESRILDRYRQPAASWRLGPRSSRWRTMNTLPTL